MKTFNFYKLITLFLLAVVATSCVQDDEFDVPDSDTAVVDLEGDVTIDQLRNLYLQELNTNENEFLTFSETDSYVTGYVISSDEGGNFFEELILQDSPANPKAGVKVLIDVNPLFTVYEFGRKVHVKLDGLTVGLDSGVLTLGIRDGNAIESIAESQFDEFLIRDEELAEIVPLPINITEFDDSKTNLYIQLENVQFNSSEVLGDNRKTFAGEPEDSFDGERILESCTTGIKTVFSTSTFADFKSLLLPQGKGSMAAILSKSFNASTFIVTVNDPSTINLDGNDRCDACGLATETGETELFRDFFETQTENTPISGNGWTNYAEAGTQLWEAYFDDSSNASLGISARFSARNTGDNSSIGWLVTPEIDFNAQNQETLNFKTSNSFSDGSYMVVLYSTNWDGSPSSIPSANWSPIPEAKIVADSDFFGDWIESGNIDLSCIEGSGHIAFKYVGKDEEDFDGTYELDEVVINSETTDGGDDSDGLDCTTPSGGGSPFFTADFEEFDAIEDYVGAGWTNVNVTGGSTVWEIGNFEGSNYAQISGFDSGENNIETWLVTPEINMDRTTGEELSFDVQASFDNGTILSVLVSTNFTGDVTTADWQTIDASIPTGPSGGFGEFQPVGPINISCLDGSVHFAFLYEGSDPDATTRYHVDNIEVTGN